MSTLLHLKPAFYRVPNDIFAAVTDLSTSNTPHRPSLRCDHKPFCFQRLIIWINVAVITQEDSVILLEEHLSCSLILFKPHTETNQEQQDNTWVPDLKVSSL